MGFYCKQGGHVALFFQIKTENGRSTYFLKAYILIQNGPLLNPEILRKPNYVGKQFSPP